MLRKQRGERPVIGINKFVMDKEDHYVQRVLEMLVDTAKDVTVELAKNGATIGDIVEKLKEVWDVSPVF